MPICVLLDLRGHGNEIFDEAYLCFLESCFAYYGEDNVFLHTDTTPFLPLKARVLSGEAVTRAVIAEYIAAAPALEPRARMPKAQVDVWKFLKAVWLREGQYKGDTLFPPLLRTMFSARCAGAYVPSAAALRTSLQAFLLHTVAPAAQPGNAVHVYWASHGNFLQAPALSSRRGVYGVVALRSEEETASVADPSLSADFLARELIAPLARALSPRGATLAWVHHSCYSAPIMAAAARCLSQGLLTPAERLCLIADRPSLTPFKRAFLAPYNDNVAFQCQWVEDTVEGLKEVVATLLTGLPGAEAALAASRVRMELERDLKSRVGAAAPDPAAPPPAAAGRDAQRPPLTVQQLRELWPVHEAPKGAAGEPSPPPTPKKQWAEWEFALSTSPQASDTRFAAGYAAAAAAGLAALAAALPAAGAEAEQPAAAAAAAGQAEAGAEAAQQPAAAASPPGQQLPWNAAIAGSLRAAAAALRAAFAPHSLAPAQQAVECAAASGFPEAALEDYYLRDAPPSPAAAAATPSGGASAWQALAAFSGADRPRFTAYLTSVATASAELSAVQAPYRLDTLAEVLEALQPEWALSGMLGTLRLLLMGSPLNNSGDQAAGSHFVSRLLVGALLGGGDCSLGALERLLYSAWAQWGLCAEQAGLYHSGRLAALAGFPEEWAGRTGVVHQWGLGWGFSLK